MKRLWRLLALSLAAILAVLLVLVFSASSWLETASGRNLLQRELGNGLNLLATLEGDYELKIFPRIQISGQRLLLHDPGESRPLAVINSYELHLALWPLLRKQIIIHKVAVRDGSLDLDFLAGLGKDETSTGSSALPLPRIQAMEITGLRLLKSAEGFLTISRLSLQDFAENRNSGFSLKLELPSTDGKRYGTSLTGLINIRAMPFEVSLDADEWMLELDGQTWPLGSGQSTWSAERGELIGKMRGSFAHFDTEYDFSVQTSEPVRLQLAVRLQSEETGLLSAQLRVLDQSGIWVIDSVELDLDGQQLTGTGCLTVADETRLQMQLFAAHLDVDALQNLLPESLMAAETAETASTPTQTDLPLELAVTLKAEQATLSGAVARDVQLQLGQEPDCGSSLAAK